MKKSSGSRLSAIFRVIRISMQRMLLIPIVRWLIGSIRLFYYVRIRKNLRTLASDRAFELTLIHNLDALKRPRTDFTMDRVDRLLRPFSAVETIGTNSNILIIGPRTENDLLMFLGYGFERSKMHAIDLISYSPWVELGDMHNIEHPDNTYDGVFCGWVLSYSASQRDVAAEITRVSKDGALIAIGIDHVSLTPEELEKRDGYAIIPADSTAEHANSADEILDLFGDAVDTVYFKHDAPFKNQPDVLNRVNSYGGSTIMVVFSLKK